MTDTPTTIHGGEASIEDRADAARQAGFYEASQRKQDWERIAFADEIFWWEDLGLWRLVQIAGAVALLGGLAAAWVL